MNFQLYGHPCNYYPHHDWKCLHHLPPSSSTAAFISMTMHCTMYFRGCALCRVFLWPCPVPFISMAVHYITEGILSNLPTHSSSDGPRG